MWNCIPKDKVIWKRIIAILIFVGIGMLGAKTGIECYLYHIPFAVKIVKNAVAFGIDSLTMIIGLGIIARIEIMEGKKWLQLS